MHAGERSTQVTGPTSGTSTLLISRRRSLSLIVRPVRVHVLDSLVSTRDGRAPFLLIGNLRCSASIRPLRRKFCRLLPPFSRCCWRSSSQSSSSFSSSSFSSSSAVPRRILRDCSARRTIGDPHIVASSSPNVIDDEGRHRRQADHGDRHRSSHITSPWAFVSSCSPRLVAPRLVLSCSPFPSRRAPFDLSLRTNHEPLREFSVTIHLSVKCVKGPPTPSASSSVEGHYRLLSDCNRAMPTLLHARVTKPAPARSSDPAGAAA